MGTETGGGMTHTQEGIVVDYNLHRNLLWICKGEGVLKLKSQRLISSTAFFNFPWDHLSGRVTFPEGGKIESFHRVEEEKYREFILR